MPRSQPRQVYFRIGRYVLVVLIAWWLVSTDKISFSQLDSGLLTAPSSILLLGCSLLLVSTSLALLAYRWQQTLGVHGIAIDYRSALSATFQANFFSIVLPGMAGGDLVKIAYITKSLDQRRLTACYATLLDRLLGVLALVVLAVVAAAALYPTALGSSFENHALFGKDLLLMPLLVFSVAAFCAFVLLAFVRQSLFQRILERIPFFNRDRQLSDFTTNCLRSQGTLIWLLLLSCLNHLINLLVYLAVGYLLAIPLTALAQLAIGAICMLVNLLPITPGGIGLTESAFYYIYFAAGFEGGGNLSLLVRMLNYFVFLGIGLPFFLFAGSRLKAAVLSVQADAENKEGA